MRLARRVERTQQRQQAPIYDAARLAAVKVPRAMHAEQSGRPQQLRSRAARWRASSRGTFHAPNPLLRRTCPLPSYRVGGIVLHVRSRPWVVRGGRYQLPSCPGASVLQSNCQSVLVLSGERASCRAPERFSPRAPPSSPSPPIRGVASHSTSARVGAASGNVWRQAIKRAFFSTVPFLARRASRAAVGGSSSSTSSSAVARGFGCSCVSVVFVFEAVPSSTSLARRIGFRLRRHQIMSPTPTSVRPMKVAVAPMARLAGMTIGESGAGAGGTCGGAEGKRGRSGGRGGGEGCGDSGGANGGAGGGGNGTGGAGGSGIEGGGSGMGGGDRGTGGDGGDGGAGGSGGDEGAGGGDG